MFTVLHLDYNEQLTHTNTRQSQPHTNLEEGDVENRRVRVDKCEQEGLSNESILIVRLLLIVLPIIQRHSHFSVDEIENHDADEIENGSRDGRYHRC